jgi:hypothetical protein
MRRRKRGEEESEVVLSTVADDGGGVFRLLPRARCANAQKGKARWLGQPHGALAIGSRVDESSGSPNTEEYRTGTVGPLGALYPSRTPPASTALFISPRQTRIAQPPFQL